MLGSLASLAPPQSATTCDDWYFDIVSGQGRIAAHLRGVGRSTLRLITGIGSKYLLPLDHSTDDRILLLDASERRMVVNMPERTFVVRPSGDCEHLVTAWTLPFLGVGGFLGFYGADIEEVGRSDAVFFDYPLNAQQLPAVLAQAHTTAVYAVFFGDVPSLRSMNDALSRLTEAVEPHVHVVTASALIESHEPRLLLTAFNDDLGAVRSC